MKTGCTTKNFFMFAVFHVKFVCQVKTYMYFRQQCIFNQFNYLLTKIYNLIKILNLLLRHYTYEAKQWLGRFLRAEQVSRQDLGQTRLMSCTHRLDTTLSLAGLQSPVSQTSRVCHVRLSAAVCRSQGARCDGPEYRLQSVECRLLHVTSPPAAVRAQPPPSRRTITLLLELLSALTLIKGSWLRHDRPQITRYKV